MESILNNQKSLKDTLLEYSVLNIDLLFPLQESNMVNNVTPVPNFPNYLFDEIIEKSKDMCWRIQAKHLTPCIIARNKLKWSETSCFRFVDDFKPLDHKLFVGCMSNLQILKVYFYLDKPTDVNFFKEISMAADTLEDLDLTVQMSHRFRGNHMTKSGAYSEEIERSIGAHKLPKLKRLRLNMLWYESFPFGLDADKLTVFDLCRSTLTKSFLTILISFTRLVHLSLCFPILREVSIGEVVDAVTSLKSLRLLNLCSISETVNELMLNKITKDLEYLDILELGVISLRNPEGLLSRRKKLKVFNYISLTCLSTAGQTALRGLAHRIGNCQYLEGIMTLLSTTPTRQLHSIAGDYLFSEKHHKLPDIKMMTEAEKSGILNFRSPLRLAEGICRRQCIKTNYDMLLRMACHSVDYEKNNIQPFLREYIRVFVESNENTHLAKRFARLLYENSG